ncbi:MAG TPA: ATP-binding protein [Kiritimatiellia bacterium]|nr:ATP-binding protein [Kiritimatiellia bacterium]HPS09313.1 ATP-binding protein [Kiritimatiellia bacterium]
MTTPATACLLLTCDSGLALRLTRVAGGMVDIRVTANRGEWAREKGALTVQLLDLRHSEAAEALEDAPAEIRSGIVVFGVPESEPYQSCRSEGVFAVEPLDVAPEHLRRTLRQAILLRQTQEELSLARQQLAAAARPVSAPMEDEPSLNLAPLDELWRAARHFQDIRKLLDQLAEGVAAASRVVRVGLFARLHDEACYRLWSGLRCLDCTRSFSVEPHDPFVRWLERHAHLICRAHLAHVDDLRDRRLLQHVLDESGAEIIVPLLGKRGLLGWIFVGHRSTGVPFAPRDLSDLTVIGEQVATLLENALLVEELAVQKTLAENLLEAIPVGILAASEDGVVRWFNRAAEQILGVTAAEAVNHPVERVGSRIADVILGTIREEKSAATVSWNDLASRRTIRADALRVGRDGACMGAMLLLSDITRERLLREKQEELERHAFWNDLAAAMSHEVRNPLVAISTFAQLLPERYADPEFREKFFGVVIGEVSRLNAIITQINAFAHPPALVFKAVSPAEIALQACARASKWLGGKEEHAVACEAEESLPLLTADVDVLADGLAHVLVNAFEAVCDRPSPRVALLVRGAGDGARRSVVFAVSDNGAGVVPEMRGKLFSPFSTTKPRGLGLGLPLARRAAVDHGGRIDVDTTGGGTTVIITLPLEEKLNNAETTDR